MKWKEGRSSIWEISESSIKLDSCRKKTSTSKENELCENSVMGDDLQECRVTLKKKVEERPTYSCNFTNPGLGT